MNKYKFTNNNRDSFFYYLDNYLTINEYIELLKELTLLNYYEGETKRNNKISRKQIFFHDNEEYFCKLWKNRYDRWNGNKYPKFLTNIQNKINIFVNKKIDNNIKVNSCLINKYDTGEDFIPHHRDNPLSFGKYPYIIGLSLGDERIMELKNNITGELNYFKLKNNSLFIMGGYSQEDYTHSILKKDSFKSRYSLTFRSYL
jgi:alkylated DNA repair dioxygenase AlkB